MRWPGGLLKMAVREAEACATFGGARMGTLRARVRTPSLQNYRSSVPWAPGVRTRFRRCGVGLALLVMSGCGYIGEPQYPALHIPIRVVDLAAVERGDKLEISFTIPAVTTEGLALMRPGEIDLRIGLAPAGGFELNQWAASARSVPVTSPEKPQGIQTSTPIDDFSGKEVIVGVRIASVKGRYSDWSNLVTVPIETPLPKPANIARESVPEGVRIHWNAPAESKFKIFRKVGDQSSPALLATLDESTYLDTTTEYGKTYTYYVQAIHGKTESDVAETEPLTPEDIFPPAVPAGLTASAAVSSVELAWERDTEPDLKGYRIFRAVNDGPFELLAEVDVPSYSDTKVEAGKRYRYQVTAIDQTGHESKPSAEAAAALP